MAEKKKSYFPSETVGDAEKNSEEYGLKVGNAIEAEWFERTTGGGVRFYDFQEEFHNLRRYARGEQSIRKYKDEFQGEEGDLSYVNLSWEPVHIIPKFRDIIVNNLDTRLFDVNVQAIDPVASAERGKHRQKLEREMVVKQYAGQLMEATGETGLSMPIDEIADNPEELELQMQLNYKQGIEIAEEQAIDFVLKRNEYEYTRKMLIEDLVTIGISAVKHSFNTADGITLEYVDPARLLWSYTDDPYFKDCYYWGEVKDVTVAQLRKEFPNLTDKDIEDILDEGQNKYNYRGSNYQTDNSTKDSNKIQVIYFTYKTFNHSVYRKKHKNDGTQKVDERDDTFKGPRDNRANYEKIQITREVLYEGAKIVKIDKILKWELQKNMVRPKADTTKVMSPYAMHAPSMYQGRIESMVRRITPYADLIQNTHLKLQQAIQRMVPDGVFIDVDSIADVDLGGGSNYNPKEALNMYFQTGSIVGRSMGQNGDLNRNPTPIQPISGGNSGDKIQILIGVYNQYLGMIRDVTGINEAVDGSTISEYALPGTQKLAAANSNVSIRAIQRGINYVTKKIAEGISLRVSDVLEFSNTSNELIQSIGQFNVASLKDIKKLHLHNFGIFINVHPDEEEKARFQEIMTMSLQGGLITPADVIDLQQINNTGLASQLLKVRQKKKQQQDQQQQAQLQEQQAQLQAQAAQQAAEAEAQKFMVEADAKSKVEQVKHQLAMEKLQADVQAKIQLMEQEFQYKMQIAQMEGEAKGAAMAQSEDRKDKRQADAASQNSKMIEQRNTKGPAYDFASLASASQNKQAVQGGGLEGPPVGGGGSGTTFESDNDSLNPVGELGVFDDADL